VLAWQLAAAAVVLAVALAARTGVAAPVPADAGLPGAGWLNAASRALLHATGWLARQALDRQAELLQPGAPERLALQGAGALAGRVGAARPGLQALATFGVAVLVAYGALAGAAVRRCLRAGVAVLLLSAVLTHPLTAVRLAGLPGRATAAATVVALAQLQPSARGLPPAAAQRHLGDRYRSALVDRPGSRLQSGGTVLADAPAAERPRLLSALRRQVPSVDAWARGDRRVARLAVALLSLGSALPLSLAVALPAMGAAVGQTLLLLLLLAGPAALLLGWDRRWRPLVARVWLLPGLAAAGLVTAGTGASALAALAAAALGPLAETLGALLATAAGLALTGLVAWSWRRRPARDGRPSRRRGAGGDAAPAPARDGAVER